MGHLRGDLSEIGQVFQLFYRLFQYKGMEEEIDGGADQDDTATGNQGDGGMEGNRRGRPCHQFENKNGGGRNEDEKRNDNTQASVQEGTSGRTRISGGLFHVFLLRYLRYRFLFPCRGY